MAALGRVGGRAAGAVDGGEACAAKDRPAAPASGVESLAFEAAVRDHWVPLVRRLVLVLGDAADAEDVAQEAYLRAYRAWDRFDGRDVRGWLYTIALRLAFNERRRRGRWLAALRHVEPRPWEGAGDPDLWAALGRLDARTRSVLLLHVIDGYTQREIAAMLDAPEGTVASWLSRGRARLREDLGPR